MPSKRWHKAQLREVVSEIVRNLPGDGVAFMTELPDGSEWSEKDVDRRSKAMEELADEIARSPK